MTVKEYLNQAYRLEEKIEADLEEIERLKGLRFKLSGSNLKTDFVQSSKSNNAPFEKCVEKLIDLQNELCSEVEELINFKNDINHLIETIENEDEKLVLKYRYIQNLTWEEIGRKLHADRTTLYRWHKKAIEKIKVQNMTKEHVRISL